MDWDNPSQCNEVIMFISLKAFPKKKKKNTQHLVRKPIKQMTRAFC